MKRHCIWSDLKTLFFFLFCCLCFFVFPVRRGLVLFQTAPSLVFFPSLLLRFIHFSWRLPMEAKKENIRIKFAKTSSIFEPWYSRDRIRFTIFSLIFCALESLFIEIMKIFSSELTSGYWTWREFEPIIGENFVHRFLKRDKKWLSMSIEQWNLDKYFSPTRE